VDVLSSKTEPALDNLQSNSSPQSSCGQYDSNYGNFQHAVYEEIRREAFGEDIGQNSWLTADEQDKFISWLHLSANRKLLDVACGAGGPALRICKNTGCAVVGLDIHEQAVATARVLADRRGLSNLAAFEVVNASSRLPFDDSTFDAITCIDAINHLPDRPSVMAEWARLLKPGGRLLFTDPVIVTGPLTNEEIRIRCSTGVYLFVPHGYDESLLLKNGLHPLTMENVTQNIAAVARKRFTARASRSSQLQAIEGDAAFHLQQEFLAIAARLSEEGRLSRFMHVAEKPR